MSESKIVFKLQPVPYKPPARPRFTRDGACAHPDDDPAGRCRYCQIVMDDDARQVRYLASVDKI